MTIVGVTYLLFLLVVWLLYQVLATVRQRQLILLGASTLFYASWGPGFLASLWVSIGFNFLLGRRLRRNPTNGLLWLGIGANLVLLLSCRYHPWLHTAYPSILPAAWLDIAAPIGVSFWTFQAIDFLVGSSKRPKDPEPSALEFSLFMSFWPTVLSGPIGRAHEFVPQLRSLRRPAWQDVASGASRISIGLFLKVVLAQLLATGLRTGEGLDSAFDRISGGWGTLDIWVMAVGYGFQLFFDFAGYSHIVIGSAGLFGIKLGENFDAPYLSTSPSEFWRRWHISLSQWLRDHVFLPIAYRGDSFGWILFASFITMVVCGVWHGAAWSFVLWGAWHGLLLVLHRVWERASPKLGIRRRTRLRWAYQLAVWPVTFLAIAAAWVPFRAHSLEQALGMLLTAVSPSLVRQRVLPTNLYLIVGLMAVGYFASRAVDRLRPRLPQGFTQAIFRLASPIGYAIMILAVILWSRQRSVFVYFQF